VTMHVMPLCVVQVGWLVKVVQESHPCASFKLKDEHLEDYNAQDLSRLSLFGGVKTGKDRQFVRPHLLIGTGHGFCTGGWCVGKVGVCSGRDVAKGTVHVIMLCGEEVGKLCMCLMHACCAWKRGMCVGVGMRCTHACLLLCPVVQGWR
jgi:hypothetical protein